MLYQRQKGATAAQNGGGGGEESSSSSSAPPSQSSDSGYSKTSKQQRTSARNWRQVIPLSILVLALIVGVGTTTVMIATMTGKLKISDTLLLRHGKEQPNTAQDFTPPGICINNLQDMPKHWRPLPGLYPDPGTPWTAQEQTLADESVEKGLDELVAFYEHNMTVSRIQKLRNNAVNSLIDEAYASESMPSYHAKALRAAARVLKINAARFATDKNNNKYTGCTKTYEKLKYVGYGQYLVNNLPDDAELATLQAALTAHVNFMLQQDCQTLESVLDVGDLSTIFRDKHAHADDVFDWTLKAIALTDALTVPNLALPEGTEEFIAKVWKYLSHYEYPYARDHRKHYGDYTTRNTAWLATHVAYVPSGYGRHKQLIGDAPYLYQYIRENFYYALEYGMLDLFCEFVDLVRQYGCTEETDYQVRHGTRYILSLYLQGGHSWMNYREDGQPPDEDESIDDYDLIHKPWTAISGVIRRKFEPIVPGSYGHAFQEALKHAETMKQGKLKGRSVA